MHLMGEVNVVPFGMWTTGDGPGEGGDLVESDSEDGETRRGVERGRMPSVAACQVGTVD
jgi:hypothetical protein